MKRKALFTLLLILALLGSKMAMPTPVRAQPPWNGGLKIMPLGDSITKGSGTCSDPDTYLNCTGYRDYLWDALESDGYSVDFVGSQGGQFQYQYSFDNDHEGHGGKTADWLANGVYGFLEDNPPEVVLLHIGTNEPVTTTNAVEGILDEIDRYSEDITVILARIILPRCCADDPPCERCQTVKDFNNNVEDKAQERIAAGDKIIVVDMENALEYPGDLGDSLHPTPAGYGKMAEVWREAIVSLFTPVPCSTTDLINAIDVANSNGEDEILNLASGCTYVLTGTVDTTDGANGLPSITSNILINGNEAEIVRSDTASDFRIFHVAAGGDLTLHELTISNGSADNAGGIYNRGTLTLDNSVVDGNVAIGPPGSESRSAGGGIYSRGAVVLINSTVSNNSAGHWDPDLQWENDGIGGGVHNFGGTLKVINSTISDNTTAGDTPWGGGVYNSGGTAELTNSTLSGNGSFYGGGISNARGSTVEVTNSTVSSNIAGIGGGIFNDGTAELTNTVVAKQISGDDCVGSITSLGYNLDSDGSCGLTATGDISNTNPLLDELKDHGGPTETHGLFASSPAIDAIPADLCPDTDQRGVPRPQGEGCDIGAFEFGETVTSCEIDLQNNTHTCSGIAAIDFVQEPSNGEVVLKVNMNPDDFGSTRAVFGISYGTTPISWTVDIGDSATNNGAGGDCETQYNDAEVDILDTAMRVWGNDGVSNDVPLMSRSDFVDSGSMVTLEISNERLDWDNHSGGAGNLVSPYLYALNGQPDSEGPINYDIYAAFNRVIDLSGCPPEARRGSGVTHVTVTLLSEPTAIDLLSFTAQAGAGHVTLAWETGTEVDNAGFNLHRATSADGPYTQINGALIPAEGDALSGASYTYTDSDVVEGVAYYYKLEDVDIHGASTFHGPVSATPGRIRRIYLPLVVK